MKRAIIASVLISALLLPSVTQARQASLKLSKGRSAILSYAKKKRLAHDPRRADGTVVAYEIHWAWICYRSDRTTVVCSYGFAGWRNDPNRPKWHVCDGIAEARRTRRRVVVVPDLNFRCQDSYETRANWYRALSKPSNMFD